MKRERITRLFNFGTSKERGGGGGGGIYILCTYNITEMLYLISLRSFHPNFTPKLKLNNLFLSILTSLDKTRLYTLRFSTRSSPRKDQT